MREQRDALQSLLKSQGWAEVEKVLNAWIESYEKTLNEDPVYDTRDMADRNVKIGESRGYRAVRGLPASLVHNLNTYIDALIKEESEDEHSRNYDDEGIASDDTAVD